MKKQKKQQQTKSVALVVAPKQRKPKTQREESLFHVAPRMDRSYLDKVRHVLPAVDGSARGIEHIQSDTQHMAQFLAAMAHPFDVPPALCPLAYNEVITLRSHAAQTTCTMFSYSVLSNYTNTIQLLPGWATNLDGIVLVQPQANSAALMTDTTGTQWTPGPCGVTHGANTYNPACVVSNYSPDGPGVNPRYKLALGTGSGAAMFGWDVPLPYVAPTNFADILRWRCTAIGIRIRNVTPAINKGGSVVTVQPTFGASSYGLSGSVSDFAVEPSFRDHGTEDVEVSYIVKPRDLSYNYPEAGDAGGVPGSLGLYIFLANKTANAQQYDLEIVYHWQVAGDFVFQISRPNPHSVVAKGVFEPAVTSAQATAGSAHQVLPEVAKASSALPPSMASELLSSVKSLIPRAAQGFKAITAPVGRYAVARVGPGLLGM